MEQIYFYILLFGALPLIVGLTIAVLYYRYRLNKCMVALCRCISEISDLKQKLIKLNITYDGYGAEITPQEFVRVVRNMLQKLLFLSSFFLVVSSAAAQEKSDTTYLFRFMPEKDMFFSPWNDNGKELERLLKAIDINRTAIEEGMMRIFVSSYGTEAANGQSAEQLAYIRRNRVKSELIVRANVKEEHFLTRKETAEAYGTVRLRNVVVLILPVDSGKDAEAERMTAEQAHQKEAQRIAAEKAEAERIAKEKELAEQKRLAEEKAAKERTEQAEQARLTTEQTIKAQGKEEQLKTTAHHFLQGWYVGVQGGLPFGISGMSSFGADKTRAGWNAGIYGGYRFSPVLSLEAQAAWGEMNLSVRNCCSGYWFGSDGNRYEATVAGMDGWNYADLKSRVATQRYGVQLNVNILGFFNSTKYNRWTLELSPQLSVVGTKAAFRTIADDTEVLEGAMRWHFGAGCNLQAGYALTDRLQVGIYTGMVYFTGKHLDGMPKHLHQANYVWESGLRLGWRFGNNGKEVRK